MGLTYLDRPEYLAHTLPDLTIIALALIKHLYHGDLGCNRISERAPFIPLVIPLSALYTQLRTPAIRIGTHHPTLPFSGLVNPAERTPQPTETIKISGEFLAAWMHNHLNTRAEVTYLLLQQNNGIIEDAIPASLTWYSELRAFDVEYPDNIKQDSIAGIIRFDPDTLRLYHEIFLLYRHFARWLNQQRKTTNTRIIVLATTPFGFSVMALAPYSDTPESVYPELIPIDISSQRTMA